MSTFSDCNISRSIVAVTSSSLASVVWLAEAGDVARDGFDLVDLFVPDVPDAGDLKLLLQNVK